MLGKVPKDFVFFLDVYFGIIVECLDLDGDRFSSGLVVRCLEDRAEDARAHFITEVVPFGWARQRRYI